MTLLDILVSVVVIAAAVAGFRRLGGSGRAGALLGLLVGAGLCSTLGAWLAATLGTDAASRHVLTVVGIVVGLLAGAAVGGWLGRLLSRTLIDGRLAALDRVLGALAGAASALGLIWLVSVAVPEFVSPEALAPVTAVLSPLGGHSTIVAAVGRTLPTTVDDIRGTLDTVRA